MYTGSVPLTADAGSHGAEDGVSLCRPVQYAFERCRVEHPRFIDAGNGHRVRCFKVENELRKGLGSDGTQGTVRSKKS